MTNVKPYVPEAGDAVWLTFDPQVGHEQRGRRPAIVLSEEAYNRPTGMGLFCPITNQTKGYPFEVHLPPDLPITGVILADQMKNFDWRNRQVEFIAKLPRSLLTQVIDKLVLLLPEGV